MQKTFLNISIFLALFSILFYISSRDKENYSLGSWRSTLWVDPAGYNVYLPATFQYSFIHNFPHKADSIVGFGFMLDNDQKVITKFTYGVALLQAPFYLGGLAVSKLFGIENSGYSFINEVLVDIAGISYCCLGLIILFKLLNQRFGRSLSFVSTLIVFIGTNALYYGTVQPGMSHIYSFFLVILSLYLLLRFCKTQKLLHFIFFSFSISLIVLIRPINILVVPALLFFFINSLSEARERLAALFQVKHVLLFLVIFFLVFLPQFVYWKFAYGHYISDSYPGEGFVFLKQPKIAEYLLSPNNGLFTYSPLYLFLLLCLFPLSGKYKLMSIVYGIVFMLLIYLGSSWHVFHFGCGFSARNFVEYSGLLAFPMAQILKDTLERIKKIFLVLIISLLTIVNLKLMYSWEICFFGSNDWSWKEYNYLLYKPNQKIVQNFDSIPKEKIVSITGDQVYYIDSLEQFSRGISFHNSSGRTYFKKADITVDLMLLDTNTNAQLACMASLKDSAVAYTAAIIDGPQRTWSRFNLSSGLLFSEDKDYVIKIFVMNDHKKRLYMKNLMVELH